jgi:hypothetical protein
MRDDTRLPRGGKDPPAVRPLRLVHPAPPPKPKTPRRRHDADVFSAEEQRMLRASLKTARGLRGSWACLAEAMRVSDQLDAVANGRRPVSAAIAVRLSKALGVPLESLMTPGLRVLKHPCPTCGGDGAA